VQQTEAETLKSPPRQTERQVLAGVVPAADLLAGAEHGALFQIDDAVLAERIEHRSGVWIPAGHIPSVDEAKERLARLERDGPTPFAFTFQQPFPPEAGLNAGHQAHVYYENR